jgi:hypothetical protein
MCFHVQKLNVDVVQEWRVSEVQGRFSLTQSASSLRELRPRAKPIHAAGRTELRLHSFRVRFVPVQRGSAPPGPGVGHRYGNF